MDSNTSSSNLPIKNQWIPEGYLLVNGPDNEKFIVPEFLLPLLEQDYQSEELLERYSVTSAPGTVSIDTRQWYPALIIPGTRYTRH